MGVRDSSHRRRNRHPQLGESIDHQLESLLLHAPKYAPLTGSSRSPAEFLRGPELSRIQTISHHFGPDILSSGPLLTIAAVGIVVDRARSFGRRPGLVRTEAYEQSHRESRQAPLHGQNRD